jgi:branched-chain amino acid transport system substrate-binding protein
MTLSRRALLGTAAALPAAAAIRPARAQKPVLKIGVLTDLSGPYQDIVGPLSVEAVRLAVAEFGVADKGFDVEVVAADHQNKPDVGSNIARQWYDRDGVDVIMEGGSSAVALAVAGVAKDKNKAFVNSGAATSDLTGKACNANTLHWTYDTYMLAKSTGAAMVKAGGDSWFFITADYAFGHALSRDVGNFVTGAGGKVLGNVRTPFPGTTDFSSFLLQAQSTGAKVIGLANAGSDTINCIKQAKEFGITATLGGLLVFLSDVHSLGLETSQGLVLTESFYWNLNDRTRAFSERLWARAPGRRPGMAQAGPYSSALHYLKAAVAMGPAEIKKDGAAAIAQLKRMPTDDDVFGPGTIREDGRKLHPAFLFQVKKPSESKGAWDYYNLLGTTPADQAFRPMSEGGCPLVKA